MLRRLHEPLCIAFGHSVSSPTVPTYQLYDLPKTVEARLYCESDDLQCVLRSAAEWEQAGGTNRSRFLAGLLKDEAMHDAVISVGICGSEIPLDKERSRSRQGRSEGRQARSLARAWPAAASYAPPCTP